MNIWLVSREYVGIAEAGGVKNVTTSLCESLARRGHDVTVFLPCYGCTDLSHVHLNDVETDDSFARVLVRGSEEEVNFLSGTIGGVNIVFVQHDSFAQKRAVYTYTHQDEVENPRHRQGEGHEDVNFLNVLFQKAVVEYARKCSQDKIPQAIHCQDAATAMVPAFGSFAVKTDDELKMKLEKTKYFVTIHNAGPGYHHNFSSLKEACEFTNLPEDLLSLGLCNAYDTTFIEPFVIAGHFSKLTTVSPEYAREILKGKTDTAGLSQKFVEDKIPVVGITNGIDFSRYDPVDVNMSLLPFAYDPQKMDLAGKYKNRQWFIQKYASKDTPVKNQDIEQFGYFSSSIDDDEFFYIAYHGRVVHQKGIAVMCEAAEKLLSRNNNLRFVFAGQGVPELEDAMKSLAVKFEGRVVYIKGYERTVARLSVAACDFSLHPSYFEPCGLEDFIAQTFGTIPVAHATGGLKKILDKKTGFLYSPNKPCKLERLLQKLIDQFNKKGRTVFEPMIQKASSYIHKNYSWDIVAMEYEKLYLS